MAPAAHQPPSVPCSDVHSMPTHRPLLADDLLQVQDVGLIFLSAMASSIAALCAEAGHDAATALGTSLLTMTISTFLVGLGTLAVGELGATNSRVLCRHRSPSGRHRSI